MVGTTLVTSGLGFVYWWMAARLFSEEAVGLASALVSAMMLLGTIGMLGFGTLLIGELPRHPEKARSLVITALTVSGIVSFCLGIVAALLISHMSPDFTSLGHDPITLLVFVVGVALTSIAFVGDQALIGMLRGDFQLGRNTLFATIKLVILIGVGKLVLDASGVTIYVTWLLGNLISLALLAVLLVVRYKFRFVRPNWEVLRGLRKATLGHFALNLALQAPSLLLPLVVTTMLSATANGSFYISWMIASFIFMVPTALSTVLFAVSAADTSVLAQKIRQTLGISLLIGLVANFFLFLLAPAILSLFGPQYVEHAVSVLRILALGAFH